MFDRPPGDQNARARLLGFVPAIVTNNKDPDGWYRVRVRFPLFSNGGASGGEESAWARVATFGGGDDRGGYFLPEVGDEVLVAFEHGDMRRPFVIGSMWNNDAKPPYDNKNGENNIRAFKSRSGHLLEFDDTKDKTKITLRSKAGSTILIDDKEEKVEIHDDGSDNLFVLDLKNKKITVESKTADILIKAKEKLTLDCKTLETKAGDAHKMSVGSTFDVKASDKFKMTGGKGHVEASSELTLKGSLVDINPPGGQAGGSAGGGSGADSQGGGGSGGGPGRQTGQAGTGTTQQSGAAAASGGNEQEQSEPEPMLVGAAWSQSRAPFGTKVGLKARCAELSGQSATFTIKNGEDDGTVTTVSGTCGEGEVSAEWTAPQKPPPHEVYFDVEAGGKKATSGRLELTRRVQVKLVRDEEVAKNVAVTLLVGGQRIKGKSDDQGMVVFEDAPSGDWKLLLDE
jgi:phage baseplate assembly protein gpV